MTESVAQNPFPSPCNKICTLNPNGICVGCGRSRAEIGGWTQFSDAEKKQVVHRAKARLDAMGGAEGPAKVKA
ncbi:DUF1289 domain-containing protein [Methylocystis parvus]|uniref:DUF1289 domain-containing protein n=1 Tax=Methylocystis parvus TaxID=134 RepID=A0A6B8M3T8_9HYPH|nr:DUF1289 domain-containing protein [Methylocystis parvus]QGM96978.1 DUF1289 domain-containing protein [Methylocystis parvus]WBJ99134.1 DUF1289 domain-containing protein [Methylocystis parvus OBBP]